MPLSHFRTLFPQLYKSRLLKTGDLLIKVRLARRTTKIILYHHFVKFSATKLKIEKKSSPQMTIVLLNQYYLSTSQKGAFSLLPTGVVIHRLRNFEVTLEHICWTEQANF